ncbi:MAG: STAS domain-containing protein [Anaerolineae bacterium]|nr:STAS domain-containing protein [Anaerolineae bacterium]
MLTIEMESLKRYTLIRLRGDADHAAAPEMEQRLLAEIDAGQANLVINGRDLAYISSAGLRALIAAQTRVRRCQPQGKIVFSELASPVERTFRMVGFHELFEIYATDTAAASSFK